jgi:hypothetical protein
VIGVEPGSEQIFARDLRSSVAAKRRRGLEDDRGSALRAWSAPPPFRALRALTPDQKTAFMRPDGDDQVVASAQDERMAHG